MFKSLTQRHHSPSFVVGHRATPGTHHAETTRAACIVRALGAVMGHLHRRVGRAGPGCHCLEAVGIGPVLAHHPLFLFPVQLLLCLFQKAYKSAKYLEIYINVIRIQDKFI
jgi:hypothetical protein